MYIYIYIYIYICIFKYKYMNIYIQVIGIVDILPPVTVSDFQDVRRPSPPTRPLSLAHIRSLTRKHAHAHARTHTHAHTHARTPQGCCLLLCPCVEVWCVVLQCAVVCCNTVSTACSNAVVSQCVAVWCSVLQRVAMLWLLLALVLSCTLTFAHCTCYTGSCSRCACTHTSCSHCPMPMDSHI